MKKLLALVLAFVMAVVPMVCFGEGGYLSNAIAAGKKASTVISFAAGDLGESLQPVSDLLNALKFNVMGGNNMAHIGIVLNDTEVVTLDYEQNEDSYYIASSLLGDYVLAVSKQDLQTIINMVNQFIPAQMTNASAFEFNVDQNGISFGKYSFTFEELMPLLNIVQKISSKAEIENGSFESETHDTASIKVTLTITGAEYAELINAIYDLMLNNQSVRSDLEAALQSSNNGMTLDEAMTQAREQVTEVCAKIESITALVYANDTEIVAIDCNVNSDTEAAVNIGYTRKTIDSTVNHSAIMTVANGENSACASFNFITNDNVVDWDCTIGLLDDNQQLQQGISGKGKTVVLDTESVYDYTAHHDWSLIKSEVAKSISLDFNFHTEYKGSDADNSCTFAISNEKGDNCFTVTAQTQIGDLQYASIISDTAVNPFKLSSDEYNEFMSNISSSAQANLMVVVFSLPSSVLNYVLNSVQ